MPARRDRASLASRRRGTRLERLWPMGFRQRRRSHSDCRLPPAAEARTSRPCPSFTPLRPYPNTWTTSISGPELRVLGTACGVRGCGKTVTFHLKRGAPYFYPSGHGAIAPSSPAILVCHPSIIGSPAAAGGERISDHLHLESTICNPR